MVNTTAPRDSILCWFTLPGLTAGWLFWYIDFGKYMDITGAGLSEKDLWSDQPTQHVLGLGLFKCFKKIYLKSESDHLIYEIWLLNQTIQVFFFKFKYFWINPALICSQAQVVLSVLRYEWRDPFYHLYVGYKSCLVERVCP